MAVHFLVWLGAIAALAGAARPHVVLLVLDDLGWADVGYHGSNFPTPNIDRLAREGTRLERMYVMPQCSPTRAAVMSGRYSFRMGMQHFTTIMPGATPGLPTQTKTVAETFQTAGYATHMVGKWHLGYSKWSQTPLGKGFDSFYGYLQGQTDYKNRTFSSCGNPVCFYPLNRFAHSPYGVGAAGYDFWEDNRVLTEDFGKYTVDMYESRLDTLLSPYGSSNPPTKPLFLYFAEQQVHIPLEAPPDPKHLEACRGVTGGSTQVNRTVLCSMASRLDESVGRLEELLKRYRMWNDTLIFAISDNGGMTSWSDVWPASASSNWPLRGGKTTVFEGGVRAISFLTGGALPITARGRTISQMLHAVDVLPTLASFAGVPILSWGDGLDAWPLIAHNASMNRTELPLNIAINPLGGIPWIISGMVHDGATNYSALISWPFKVIVGDSFIMNDHLVENKRRDGWWNVDGQYLEPAEARELPYRLYNLEEDETEHHNLADIPEYKDILTKLVERIKWYASKDNGYVQDQFNLPKIRGNPWLHNWTWAPFLSEDNSLRDVDDLEEDLLV